MRPIAQKGAIISKEKWWFEWKQFKKNRHELDLTSLRNEA